MTEASASFAQVFDALIARYGVARDDVAAIAVVRSMARLLCADDDMTPQSANAVASLAAMLPSATTAGERHHDLSVLSDAELDQLTALVERVTVTGPAPAPDSPEARLRETLDLNDKLRELVSREQERARIAEDTIEVERRLARNAEAECHRLREQLLSKTESTVARGYPSKGPTITRTSGLLKGSQRQPASRPMSCIWTRAGMAMRVSRPRCQNDIRICNGPSDGDRMSRRVRPRTPDELLATRARALARAHRFDRKASAEPHRGSQHRAAAKAARRLAAEVQVRIEAMRHDEQFSGSMTPPHAGWTLRAWRTLSANGETIARGAEISAEQLAKMANAPAMLSGGHIRWQPPTVPKPQAKPAPQPQRAASAPAPDPVEVLSRALHRIAGERGVTLIDAEDLVPRDMWLRGMKHYIDEPKMVRDGGWGSGGGQLVSSGKGTTRRILNMDAFRARLRGEQREGAPA